MIKINNKEKIIKMLLKSPKTTGKIAIELGYIDNNGYGKYNIIYPDLNTLEKYGFIHGIKSNLKSPGAPPTTYDIVYEISILRKMLKKYPSIISDLQKNERIISIIAEQQELLLKYPPDSWELNNAKRMLSLSLSFFNNYIINSSFLESFCELWCEANRNLMDEDNITLDYKKGTKFERVLPSGEKWIFSRPTSPISEILIEAFQHSIITDRINGEYDPKSLDFLKIISSPNVINCYPKKPIFKSFKSL